MKIEEMIELLKQVIFDDSTKDEERKLAESLLFSLYELLRKRKENTKLFGFIYNKNLHREYLGLEE